MARAFNEKKAEQTFGTIENDTKTYQELIKLIHESNKENDEMFKAVYIAYKAVQELSESLKNAVPVNVQDLENPFENVIDQERADTISKGLAASEQN
ncbi:MAG: hypothetical protein R3B45_03310 [Bdellovibrionota bacterium]